MSSAPSTYDVDLDAAWTANGHCTAGYLAAVVARATLEDQRAPFPAVTSVHARYLRVTASAPVGHSPDVPAQDDRLRLPSQAPAFDLPVSCRSTPTRRAWAGSVASPAAAASRRAGSSRLSVRTSTR